MNHPIQFKMSYDKAIEAIVWLAKNKPGIDIYHISKTLFYADKMHINKYGRPIIGDTYIRMNYGPVPSGVFDLIKGNTWLSPRQLFQIKKPLVIDKRSSYKTAATREPDMDYFSKSDIQCLEESLSIYGDLSFDELYDLTHSERCYRETNHNEKIDYALLIDNDTPFRDEILKNMEENSQYIQF